MIYTMRVRCGGITYVAMSTFWTEEPDGESIHPSGEHYRKRKVHCIELHSEAVYCTPSKGECLSQSQSRSRCYCIPTQEVRHNANEEKTDMALTGNFSSRKLPLPLEASD